MAKHIPLFPPPFKIKTIEFITLKSSSERKQAIEEAGYNTFLLRSEDVYIDLLTDSGTSAMSDRQQAALQLGDEAYAGSTSFYHFEEAVRNYFGYHYVIPTHQGRGAEHLASKVLIVKQGQFVPNNLYFTTSRFHQENAGGVWVDVSIPEASDLDSCFPFKGNIDTNKLAQIITQRGAENIAFVRIEASLNMAGGQPFSMENLRDVSELCRNHNIFLLLDATRISENALFLKQREKSHQDKSIKDIVREICSLTDGCTMSSKKDHFVSIGGFFATNNKAVFDQIREIVVLYEGLDTYGGMSGRDMEALAVGIEESVREDLLCHYTNHVLTLGNMLEERGISVIKPLGAHGVFIDAKRFLNHIPQDNFPAQTLAAEIYLKGGIRGMERGVVSGAHGNEKYDGLELVRLTLPRRVYTLEHYRYVADVVHTVWKRREHVVGLKMVYEPKALRFFLARFERCS